MEKKSISLKATWIAAIATIVVAIISATPSIINLFKDTASSKGAFSVGDTEDTSIITGNGNTVNNNYNNYNNYFRKKSTIEEIYSAELYGLKIDDRLVQKTLQHYKELDARSLYHENITEEYKETKLDIAKGACYTALGINESHYYLDIFNHDFVKILYKDNNSKNIIKACKKVSSISSSDSEYLYYVALGYHLGTDYKGAMKYLEKAANAGSQDAKRKLGIIYMTGSITKKNESLGKKLLIEAASAGDLASKEILAIF